MIIQEVRTDERANLLSLAVQTGLFSPEEAEGLLGGVLDSLSEGQLPAEHAALACRPSEDCPAVGWSYCAPDQYAEGVMNIWWIGVAPSAYGTGAGKALLSHVERAAAASGYRIIVIETSDQPLLARARSFYLRAGYAECGRVPDFYGPGDSKVIFSRSVASAT